MDYNPGMHAVRRLTAVLLGFSFLAGLSLGCGKGPPPGGKVLFIGLDGLEWDLVTPMVEAGELPNLARLIRNGIHGKLRSLEPLAKSPTIWATIATGKTPAQHGIGAFVDPRDQSPVTQNQRRVRAVWNILSGLDRTVGVVGWMQSWPAEPVNGYMVSDYLQYGRDNYNQFEKRTYPPELEESLKDDVVEWQELPWDGIQRFLSVPLDTTKLADHDKHELERIRMFTAADLTFARIGEKLYREQPTEFFAVYLRGTDTLAHLFWNYCFEGLIDERRLDPGIKPYVDDIMRRYYRYVDELIGPIIDLADKETTIFVVSDHGFRGGTGRGIEQHKVDGVLIVSGRGVGRGEITGASVFDITPTLLTFMGLPAAQDMRGNILWSVMGNEIPRDRFTTLIGTYESGTPNAGQPIQSPVDDEIKERLRSLGYLDD
jgi:predicted AlkP superfamily phosphohydrolase/phosphomutase